jgi:hypothetical protein
MSGMAPISCVWFSAFLQRCHCKYVWWHGATLHLWCSAAQNIDDFLESYAADIEQTLVIQESSGSITPGYQAALLSFKLRSTATAFCRLYNDLHFPNHRWFLPSINCKRKRNSILHHSDAAPCMVVLISTFKITSICGGSSDLDNVRSHVYKQLGIDSLLVYSTLSYSSYMVCSPITALSIPLPKCPVCLRRIVHGISKINLDSRMPLHSLCRGHEAKYFFISFWN